MNAISIVADSKLSKCRVLLLDGDPALLKSNRLELEAAGYVVETAGSRSEAIQRLVAQTPAVGAERDVLRAALNGHCLVPASDAAAYERLLQRNVTQMSRLLGQAQNAEDRYRTLFELASDAITLLTPDGAILEANKSWESLLGIARDELVGRHFLEFVTQGAGLEDFRRLIDAGTGRTDPISLCRADGRTVYVEFSASLVDIAGERMVVAIGRDVTEAVAARAALSAAEERYRTLLERIPDVIWTSDADGRIAFATPNLAALLGRTLDEYGATTLEERAAWLHPDDRVAVVTALRAFGNEGRPFDMEYRLRHRDGRWIWVRNRSTARYERDGVRYMEGMLSDITDRKILEESLCQAQKIEAVGQLTGGIAHDFNNILSAILANSHFLLESLDAGDKRREDAEEVRVAAERGATLTRQLLAFSRRQVLQPAIVDLNLAVASVQKMLCRLIGEDITLTVTPGAALGTVRVDVGQLEQVVMNLLVNARDAMPQGGEIRIETANVDVEAGFTAGRSELAPGRYVMLSVTDTGSGMDAETQRHLFEPFFTTKPLGKGTGLGLSTCYGIVKQSGGHICVESELGRGSVFRIFLPRIEERLPSRPPPPVRAERPASETILLVEDDARLRSAVRRMLGQLGYDVLVASNADEAREVTRRHAGHIDLVLTDVVMPRESGPDFAQDARAKLGCKVLFMSGYTDHAALHAGVLERGQSFIQKPFTPEALAKKLREVLDV